MNALNTITAGPPAVYAAINAVMADIGGDGIAKGRKTSGGATFSFRGIDDVYNAMSPILVKHGLMILPRMISCEHNERISAQSKPVYWTYVTAEFDLVCAIDGSMHTCRTFGEALDSSDKSTNKAMSAAFKYAAMQAFCIPTEGDNDADATSLAGIQPRHSNTDTGELINKAQLTILQGLASAGGADLGKFCTWMKVESLADIPASQFERAQHALASKVKAS